MTQWMGNRVDIGLEVLEKRPARTEEEIQTTIEDISKILNVQGLEVAEKLIEIYLLLKAEINISFDVTEKSWRSSKALEDLEGKRERINRDLVIVQTLLRIASKNWSLENQWLLLWLVDLLKSNFRDNIRSVEIQLETLLKLNVEDTNKKPSKKNK